MEKAGKEGATHPNVLERFPVRPDTQDGKPMCTEVGKCRWVSGLGSWRQKLYIGQAKEVCSYAKKKEGKEKEQGNPGAREEVSFHTEPQRWNNAKSGRATHSDTQPTQQRTSEGLGGGES